MQQLPFNWQQTSATHCEGKICISVCVGVASDGCGWEQIKADYLI